MSGISFMGVGSGLPVSEIIDVMLKAEGAPLKRLEHDKEYYKSQISGLGQLKSRLSGLQEAMKKLQGLDKFQMLAANTGNEKLFTAKADHALGAQAGNYNVEVLAEARNYRYVSASQSTSSTLTGNLTFKDADGNVLKDKDNNDISIDFNGKTLDEVRQLINNHEGLKGKVSATLVNEGPDTGRLIMNSGVSGEEGRFTAEFSNDVIKKDDGLSSPDLKYYQYASTSHSTTATLTGDLTFKDANGNNIIIDVNGKKLDEVITAINQDPGLQGKVSAELVNEGPDAGRLVIKSKISGEQGRFTAEFEDTNINKDTTKSSPDLDPADSSTSLDLNLDARIKIDGIEATSSTNEFTNVISGVTINVTAGAMNETNKAASLGVKRDDAAIKDNIDAFVKAYNDVVIHLNEAKKGSLYGDNTIRSIETELRNILYEPTKGSNDKDTQENFLALIGIEVFVEKSFDPDNPSSRNGTLEINSAKLTEALDKNFDKVAHILGSSDRLDSSQPKGYAQRLDELAKDLISGGVRDGKIYKGLLEVRTEGLNKQIKRIDERVESTNMRLELLEQRLIKQFSSIDGIVANLNSMGSFISQQIGSLPGYSRSK